MAAVALGALVALSGCSAATPAPRVTVTAPPAAANPTPETPSDVTTEAPPEPTTTAPPEPAVTEPPEPVVTPPPAPAPTPDSGGSGLTMDTSIVVTQGAVAAACTHSVCHFVHVAWSSITPGYHSVECVSSVAAVGAWSTGNYNFPTSSGERDIGCFLGYDGSMLWVIIDDTIESSHGHWG